MSNRERWTVYPLLFLTLGIALTDKVTRMVRTDTVICKTLLVTDRSGKNEQVILSSAPNGGLIRTLGSHQGLNVMLGHTNQLVGLMFTDPTGKPIGLGTVLHAMGHIAPKREPEPDGNSTATPGEPNESHTQPAEGEPASGDAAK